MKSSQHLKTTIKRTVEKFQTGAKVKIEPFQQLRSYNLLSKRNITYSTSFSTNASTELQDFIEKSFQLEQHSMQLPMKGDRNL